jgi:CBS domain-containing protein
MHSEFSERSAMRVERLAPLTASRLTLIDMGDTIQTAASSLSNPEIGLVVVRGDGGKAIGVISKSDLVRHLMNGAPASTSAMSLMSQDIISCMPDDEVRAAWSTMVERRLQNMPVLSADGKPLGVLDIRDAMKALYEEEEFEEQMLANYIAGIGYQ